MPSQTTLTLLHKEAKKRVFLQGTVQRHTVPHLKDLIHIYLELEDQDLSRNLKMTYALSNNPYFTS